MKRVLLLALLLFYGCLTIAQTGTPRQINFKRFNRDSVNLPFNEDYYLIEDSCAQIIRYGHFNFDEKFFFGPFEDASKANSKIVLSRGNYTSDGLRNGAFESHFLNGNLQATGNYKLNNYDGHWQFYYESGKPRLSLNATDGDISIKDAWNKGGAKVVDNGNGIFIVDIINLCWKGKLMNGKPDGTWKLYRTDDVSESAMVTETFKKGIFKKGVTQYTEYTDKSHIVLLSSDLLPFLHAERMLISSIPCNGSKRKHIVNAQYRNGFSTFNEYIKDQVAAYFKDINYRQFNDSFTIEGEVSEKGNIGSFKYKDVFRPDIARGIVLKLRSLPLLEPATVDGIPVKQKFTITFFFENSYYRFSYKLLPISLNN